MLLDPDAMPAWGQCIVRVSAGLAFILLIPCELCWRLARRRLQNSSQAWHPLSLEVVSFSVT